MSQTLNAAIAVVGIDIGKNSFHVVGQDERGAIVLRQTWSRGRVEGHIGNFIVRWRRLSRFLETPTRSKSAAFSVSS